MLDTTRYLQHDGLDRFISWLAAQPENIYEWDDCEDCLFSRYRIDRNDVALVSHRVTVTGKP